ncbi:MAG: DUF4190 domain-containing protein [Arcobacteraceae bacterium]
MQGTILSYTIQTGKGLISGNDGKRYEFEIKNWISTTTNPNAGIKIDFEVQQSEAINIYLLQQAPQYSTNQDTSITAILSLIFGILGLTSTWFFFAIPSIMAVLFGHVALWNINANPQTVAGKGLAIAGLLLGYSVILIYILLITVFIGILSS